MAHFGFIKDLLAADLFRDKCEACGMWTVFELSLTDGTVCARCTHCGDSRDFARDVAAARQKIASIKKRISVLEKDYPQLLSLNDLGAGVSLPWYVLAAADVPTKAA